MPRSHLVGTLAELAAWGDFGDLTPYLEEIESDRAVLDHVERAVAAVPEFRTKRWAEALQLGTYRIVLYALVRGMAPVLAIETGVLHGLTSLVLLAALARNGGSGRLVSVDLPSYAEAGPANHDGYMDTLPAAHEPGWIVGQPYAARWDLRLGRSLDVLPTVLAECARLDFFLHDSEHTYATMSGELTLAWDHLARGGVLVCDNIDANRAFADFCRGAGQVPFLVSHHAGAPARFGIVLK